MSNTRMPLWEAKSYATRKQKSYTFSFMQVKRIRVRCRKRQKNTRGKLTKTSVIAISASRFPQYYEGSTRTALPPEALIRFPLHKSPCKSEKAADSVIKVSKSSSSFIMFPFSAVSKIPKSFFKLRSEAAFAEKSIRKSDSAFIRSAHR